MNDQELEKMILETYKISRENREYLRRIEGRQKIENFSKYAKAAILVAMIVIGYLYLSPHWAEIQATFKNVQETTNTIQEMIPTQTTP